MARLSGTVLKNAKPAKGVPFVTGPIPALPPKPADDRNWQQKFRDWGNATGEWLLGPHMNEALGRAGQAVQFTDAGDMMDAASSSATLGQAVKQGRYWDAAKEAPWTLAAAGFAAMPVLSAGPLDNMAKEAVQGAGKAKKLTPEVLPKKGIRAFHGSPYSFDKFSMDKIGTGEGAQAYGHGLYFAEHEPIAKGYRDALSEGVTYQGKKHHENDGSPEWYAANHVMDLMRAGLPAEKALAETQKRFSDAANEIDLENGSAAVRVANVQRYRMQNAIADAVDGLSPTDFSHNPGSMYEVNIDADPNTFLDWDKPLSEQPEAVRKAFEAVDKKINSRGDIYTPGTYEDAGDWVKHFQNAVGAGEAQNRLKAAGIPGIKYLDAGSRGAGDGTRNYVVFDDRLISIVRKYGIAGASAMLGYNILNGMDDAQAAELQKYEPKRLTPEKLKGQNAGR